MAKRIAAMVCGLSIIHGSVCSAQSPAPGDGPNARPVPVIDKVDKYDGPLRRASSIRAPFSTPRAGRATVKMWDDASGKRPWVERHPVLTGAFIGFVIGVGLTYAAAKDDRKEFLTPVSTGSAAIFWGGVSAGVGALAGWGIGRADK
jgi:hypothetical protein